MNAGRNSEPCGIGEFLLYVGVAVAAPAVAIAGVLLAVRAGVLS